MYLHKCNLAGPVPSMGRTRILPLVSYSPIISKSGISKSRISLLSSNITLEQNHCQNSIGKTN